MDIESLPKQKLITKIETTKKLMSKKAKINTNTIEKLMLHY